MPTLGTAYLSSILGAAEGPCVSIYLPTHRSYPDNQQDHIRYKNLVRAAEDALAKGYPGRDVRAITEKLHALQNDATFWGSGLEGVAVLASPTRFDVFKLTRKVAERAEVGDTFHVKPLIRHVQSADRFHVLGLSRDRVALFEGNRYELHPVHLPGVPLTRTGALQAPAGAERLAATALVGTGTRGDRVTDGRGDREPEALPEVDEFFRVVDRSVLELASNPAALPVIPMGITENLSEFRRVTKNRFVVDPGVSGDWTNWSLNEIREKAWKVFERFYLDRLNTIREDYGTAAARKLATADLVEAAQAGIAGRVGTLLVDADKTLPGAIELTTGNVRPAGPDNPQPGDMLDDLGELVLRNGGTVTVVPSDKMPTTTGLAAIYRY